MLREFLRVHRSEVLSVCLTEFNQEIYMESFTENEDIFRMVTQNKAYRDLSREEVFKYL